MSPLPPSLAAKVQFLTDEMKSMQAKLVFLRGRMTDQDQQLLEIRCTQEVQVQLTKNINQLLARNDCHNVDLSEYLPFDTARDVRAFWQPDDPQNMSTNSLNVRCEALTNYLVGSIKADSRWIANALRKMFSGNFRARHYWPTPL